MFRGLFVTGTDTGVGKTVVSAALMHRFRGQAPLRYWKPVQTGIEQDDDTAEVGRLGDCADCLVESGVRLPRPLSPHLAARLANTTIDLDSLIGTVSHEPASMRWIVEGAGGVLVPVNDQETMADLMTRLDLPAVVVTRTALGTINHTLLTLEALRQRAITIAGVVMVGEPSPDNRDAIERYGRIRILGELPCLKPLTPRALQMLAQSAIDPDGHLAGLLR